MLKFITLRLPFYQHIENKELVYDAFKWETTLPLLLFICKNVTYYSIYYISLLLLAINFKNLEILFLLLGFAPYVLLFIRLKRNRNPFFPNALERFLAANIRKHLITPNGNALNKRDFKFIKEQDPYLYLEITSDYSQGMCYSYARKIALLFPDSKLIYCSITNPFNQDEIFAHAILERNGEIYDTNRRMSYKIDDYKTIFKVQIYKTWTYDEFKKENFREVVRDNFRKWCKQNNVQSYNLF